MKNNVNYVIQGILAIAVIILFVMYFSGKKSNTPARKFTAHGRRQKPSGAGKRRGKVQFFLAYAQVYESHQRKTQTPAQRIAKQ